MWIGHKAQGIQIPKQGILGGGKAARWGGCGWTDAVGGKRERSGCGDLAIELSQATRGAIARIGEGLFAARGQAGIHVREGGFAHVDFSADFNRARGGIGGQLPGNGPDRSRVGEDAFSHLSVPACGGLHESSVFIG